MKFLYFLQVIILLACNSSQENKSPDPLTGNLKKDIIGQWGSPVKERPTFDITKDSIYHFATKKSYSYTWADEDLVMIDNGIAVKWSKIQLRGDTLSFENPPGYEIAATRFKSHHSH